MKQHEQEYQKCLLRHKWIQKDLPHTPNLAKPEKG